MPRGMLQNIRACTATWAVVWRQRGGATACTRPLAGGTGCARARVLQGRWTHCAHASLRRCVGVRGRARAEEKEKKSGSSARKRGRVCVYVGRLWVVAEACWGDCGLGGDETAPCTHTAGFGARQLTEWLGAGRPPGAALVGNTQ